MQLWWLKVRIHPTWHFTVFCGGIVLGLGLSVLPLFAIFYSYVWLMVAGLLFAFVLWRQWRWLLVLALLAGMFVGLACGTTDISERSVYMKLVGKQVEVTGRVSEDPDIGKRGETLLRIGDVQVLDRALPGSVWVATNEKNTIQRSDIVTVKGLARDGFGSFGMSMYRAEIVNVKRPTPGDVALHVRDDFGEKVRLGIHEPAASLGMGYLAGQRRSLPPDLDEALRLAGLTHIVVASGYNLTILVRMMKRLFEKRSRYLTVFMSLLLVGSFVAVTGASPSMTRAGLIAVLALAAWYFGRKFHPVTLLVFAAAVTGLIEPSYVWGNLGWQLSFAAFGGVMIVAPLLQAYFFGDKKPGFIRQVLGETVSAQIVTAPLILLAFGTISNVAVLANLLVLPLVPLAMLLTFITGLVGYIVPGFAHIAGLPAQWLLDYMVWVTQTTAGVSWAQTEFALPVWGLIVSYIVIIAACWWMQRATKYRLRETSIVD